MRYKFLAIVIVFLFFVLRATPIIASESIKGNDEILESVLVVTKRGIDSSEQSSSTIKLKQENLNNLNQEHIQETLNSIPGVHYQRGNGQEMLGAIRSPVFTGAGSCGAFLITQDSIPIRASGFCNVNQLFETHFEDAASIELQKGPGNSYFGSNALHGIVNINTKYPFETPNTLAYSLGSDNYHQFLFSRSFSSQNERHPERRNQLYEKTHALSAVLTKDGGFRDESDYEQQKLNYRYLQKKSDSKLDAGISLTHLDQQTAGFIRGPDAYLDSQISTSNPTPEAYRQAKSLRGWLRYDKQITANRSINLTPYLRYTDMDFLQHFLPGDPLEQNGQFSIGILSNQQAEITDTQSISFGLDAEWTNAFLKQTQDTPTQGSPFLMETIPLGTHYDYDVDASQIGVFIDYDLDISPSLNLKAQTRLASIKYDYDNQMLDGRTRDDGSDCGFGGCRYSRPADRTDRFNNWNASFSLEKNLTDEQSLFFKVARGYRTPQATELYRLQREQRVADLDSTVLSGVEVGYRISDSKNTRYQLDVNLYAQKKKNVIFRDTDFFNISDGQTEHHGLELTGSFNITPELLLSTNWNLSLIHI